MPRPAILSLVAAVALGASLLVPTRHVVVAAVPAASAANAIVVSSGDHFAPQRIGQGSPGYVQESATTSAVGDHVRITAVASGAGLAVSPRTQAPTDSRGDLIFTVRAKTPGLHLLRITYSTPGLPSLTTRRFILTPGGRSHVASHGDLTGRRFATYANEDRDFDVDQDQTAAVSFLDPRWAYVGLPPHGLPQCRRPDARAIGCKHYYYDARSGVVQVGDTLIGRFLGGQLRVSGLHRDDFSAGGQWWPSTFLDLRLRPLPPGRKLQGRWHREPTAPFYDGPVFDVRFHRNGRFVMTEDDYGDLSVLRGSYRVGRRGLLQLTGGFGRRQLSIFGCIPGVRTHLAEQPTCEQGAPGLQPASPRSSLAISIPDTPPGTLGVFFRVERSAARGAR